MKKAFTLIELVVAVALLAIIFLFAGVIFKVSINSYRTAVANAEIMQMLRAITDQLNADFKGLRKDAPVVVAFSATGSDPKEIRSDRILIFSDGDFQSTQQYKGKTVVGNVARIYYGQSAKPDPNTNNTEDFREVLLARKLQILTADDTLADTDPNDPNNFNEYTKKSLSEWKLVQIPSDLDQLSDWIGRPDVHIDLGDPARMEQIMPAFMAKGVHNFKIQLMKSIDSGNLVWWPSNQEIINKDTYPGFPPAFRFTFTLYDSKGIIKEGRTFTHTVYLGE
jgi:prepilin-type N-terminal cleavage/methylation domain-containing protein